MMHNGAMSHHNSNQYHGGTDGMNNGISALSNQRNDGGNGQSFGMYLPREGPRVKLHLTLMYSG